MNKMKQFAVNLTDFKLEDDNDEQQNESKTKSMPISVEENKFTFKLNQNFKITDKGLFTVDEDQMNLDFHYN